MTAFLHIEDDRSQRAVRAGKGELGLTSAPRGLGS